MSHLKNCSIHCVEAESEHPVAGDGTEVMEIVAVTRQHEGAPRSSHVSLRLSCRAGVCSAMCATKAPGGSTRRGDPAAGTHGPPRLSRGPAPRMRRRRAGAARGARTRAPGRVAQGARLLPGAPSPSQNLAGGESTQTPPQTSKHTERSPSFDKTLGVKETGARGWGVTVTNDKNDSRSFASRSARDAAGPQLAKP